MIDYISGWAPKSNSNMEIIFHILVMVYDYLIGLNLGKFVSCYGQCGDIELSVDSG